MSLVRTMLLKCYLITEAKDFFESWVLGEWPFLSLLYNTILNGDPYKADRYIETLDLLIWNLIVEDPKHATLDIESGAMVLPTPSADDEENQNAKQKEFRILDF
jgi:hypothetical protein